MTCITVVFVEVMYSLQALAGRKAEALVEVNLRLCYSCQRQKPFPFVYKLEKEIASDKHTHIHIGFPNIREIL